MVANIEELLRWRFKLADAETDSPQANIDWFLEATKPWWKKWPEAFSCALESLEFGYAQADETDHRGPARAPMVVLKDEETIPMFAEIAAIDIVDGRMSLLIRPQGAVLELPAQNLTFIGANDEPLFEGTAVPTGSGELRVSVQLPPALAERWKNLRVWDNMPFRLISRPIDDQLDPPRGFAKDVDGAGSTCYERFLIFCMVLWVLGLVLVRILDRSHGWSPHSSRAVVLGRVVSKGGKSQRARRDLSSGERLGGAKVVYTLAGIVFV